MKTLKFCMIALLTLSLFSALACNSGAPPERSAEQKLIEAAINETEGVTYLSEPYMIRFFEYEVLSTHPGDYDPKTASSDVVTGDLPLNYFGDDVPSTKVFKCKVNASITYKGDPSEPMPEGYDFEEPNQIMWLRIYEVNEQGGPKFVSVIGREKSASE